MLPGGGVYRISSLEDNWLTIIEGQRTPDYSVKSPQREQSPNQPTQQKQPHHETDNPPQQPKPESIDLPAEVTLQPAVPDRIQLDIVDHHRSNPGQASGYKTQPLEYID